MGGLGESAQTRVSVAEHEDEATVHSECPCVLIPESEAQLLAGLIGRHLERIRFDGVSASLEFGSCVVAAYPEPGAGGSPAFPNEEIMRLFVRAATPRDSTSVDNSSPLKRLELGKRVTDIHINSDF
jgi:hypothetical protein